MGIERLLFRFRREEGVLGAERCLHSFCVIPAFWMVQRLSTNIVVLFLLIEEMNRRPRIVLRGEDHAARTHCIVRCRQRRWYPLQTNRHIASIPWCLPPCEHQQNTSGSVTSKNYKQGGMSFPFERFYDSRKTYLQKKKTANVVVANTTRGVHFFQKTIVAVSKVVNLGRSSIPITKAAIRQNKAPLIAVSLSAPSSPLEPTYVLHPPSYSWRNFRPSSLFVFKILRIFHPSRWENLIATYRSPTSRPCLISYQ